MARWAGDENSFNCDYCHQLFGSLPENLQPNCEEIDEDGLCPKKVPRLLARNLTAHEVFAVIIETAGFLVPEIGTVSFDSDFVYKYLSILEDREFERQVDFLKVLLLVSVFNEKIVEKRNKEMKDR